MRVNRSVLPVVLLASFVSAAADTQPVTLFSAGSTFIYPIMGKWRTEYRKLHSEVQISYDPVGSSHGVARNTCRIRRLWRVGCSSE